MRLAFMGTPDFAVPSLAELIASGHEVAAVYSQLPRPKGRGQQLTPSPVHTFAETMGLPVFTPASMKSAEAIETFRSLDVDAACVVAYGQILKREVLEAPRLGCFNLHGSLLPRWRGAAPIQRAIMAGDRQTGVQIMRMSEGLDEGPILLSEVMDIRPDDTAATLAERMSHTGASLWSRALAAIDRGGVEGTEQVGEPTYAKKITSAEARIDWTRPAAAVDAHIRGLSPIPGAWFEAPGPDGPVRIKALMSRGAAEGAGAPGQVLDGGLRVACAEGAVELLRVQRAGKAVQTPEEMLRGFPLPVGTVLSSSRSDIVIPAQAGTGQR
ncbi:MAG TPA: methionyl-tRNA formyltransferase [Brevundimonas sp.]|nr:methionyl-tRNA formyltransferase [Brevundimonas sp.]